MHEPALDTKWERELATAIKLSLDTHLLAPVCPKRYQLPWCGAERRMDKRADALAAGATPKGPRPTGRDPPSRHAHARRHRARLPQAQVGV